MQDFSRSVESETVREELLNATNGRGAFRKFKDALQRHDIEQSWFRFREEALRQIAIDWCEEHKLAWN